MTANTSAPTYGATAHGWTRALCWATVTLEGFDIVALSASLPTILDTGHAGIGKAEATFITTISLVGILVGAVLVGPISDRVGRKVSLMGSIALFSVLTLAVPWAPDATAFAALRFFAGIGLGACMPAALTMMSETVRPSQRARGTTLAMTGYHTGAMLTALVGLAVMPDWEWLFGIGGVVGLAVLPVMWAKLPETSERVLARRSGERQAERVPLSAVLRQPFLVASVATWVASFMGLLLVYGLISWLPTIMSEAGYKLSTSLVMLFLLNLGGVAGLVLAGFVGDARGIRPSAIGWFLAAAVFLGLLSVKMPTLLLDVAVFVTGVFVFSAQVLVYAWITRSYPADVRGTALGLSSGIGRVGSIVGPTITGALVTAGIAYPWGFYFFSAVALLAVAAMVAVPRGLERSEAQHEAAPSRSRNAEEALS
ncbi:MFS transporter [Nocardioides sp. MAHUQ-72]|uniref:MFS transporter n=1 Tax=unclassified Nocardioides TaxID=2615069 RepID=UPI0036163552